MREGLPRILFVHAVTPGQHNVLCDYLNRNQLAHALYMTTPGHVARYGSVYSGLVPFQPDGAIVGPQSYYYSDKVERSARISKGVLSAIEGLHQQEKIDLIVAHGMWGGATFLYDELDIPIISYIEFPSYRLHGWNPLYPPTKGQRMTDKNMEMLQFYQVLRSTLTIVPTQYAKSLFPPELQHRIEVQFEGFDLPIPTLDTPESRKGQPFTIAFSARDLSSAKGYDTYIRLCSVLAEREPSIRCVVFGSDQVSTYGYESQFLKTRYPGEEVGFHEHLIREYPNARVELFGKMPYAEFSKALADVDVFVYPLRHGVGNWGLLEILGRGKAVVASNRCFVPEVIESGRNGLLVNNPDNIEEWIAAILQIKSDWALRQRLQASALKSFDRFRIESVASAYLRIFQKAIDMYRKRV